MRTDEFPLITICSNVGSIKIDPERVAIHSLLDIVNQELLATNDFIIASSIIIVKFEHNAIANAWGHDRHA
jgi:hypothetical protein